MKLRNINPLGAVELPLIGRTLEPGEVFEVPDDLAGHEPATHVDEDTQDQVHDPGQGLLGQVGNFERAGDDEPLGPPLPTLDWSRAQLVDFASRRGVDTTGLKSKPEILAAIDAVTDTSEEQA